MKSIFKYVAMLVTGFGLAACSAEDFKGATGDIPVVTDYEENFVVTVDQATNNVTFEFESAPGITPVWIIDGTTYSTEYSFTRFYRKVGTYSVECKARNRDGVSDGSITKTFEIEQTQMAGFGGFDPESDFNLFKGFEWPSSPAGVGVDYPAANPDFYYAPGWSEIEAACVANNGTYTVTLPTATTERWQAQMALHTGLALNADTHYDFSVILTSTTDIPAATVKLCQSDDDNTILMNQEGTVSLQANEPIAVWGADLPGVDISNLKIVFDFGGNPANTEIIIESIVLKDHANDDGTEIPETPSQPSVPQPTWVAVDSEDNLWNGVDYTMTYYYASGDSWAVYPNNPTMTQDGTAYTFSLPEPTNQQWQAQCTFLTTNVSTSADQTYDFSLHMTSNTDLPSVTVKLCSNDGTGDDDNIIVFLQQNIALTAGLDTHIWGAELSGQDIGQAKLVLDFGGNQANTEVTVKDIILQVHQ